MIATSLPAELVHEAYARLDRAAAAAPRRPPAPLSTTRRPVHTVYGGAHLFRADIAQKLGAAAIRAFEEYAPDHLALAAILGLPGPIRRRRARSPRSTRPTTTSPPRPRAADWLAHAIHARVLEKLRREPVEDLRIDFEDGYGARPDDEEDEHAVAAGRRDRPRGWRAATLPPFDRHPDQAARRRRSRRRAVRTLDSS